MVWAKRQIMSVTKLVPLSLVTEISSHNWRTRDRTSVQSKLTFWGPANRSIQSNPRLDWTKIKSNFNGTKMSNMNSFDTDCMTLTRFVLAEQMKFPDAEGFLSQLLNCIQTACKVGIDNSFRLLEQVLLLLLRNDIAWQLSPIAQ